MSITPVTWQESLPNAVPEEKGSNTRLDKFGISLFSTTGRTCPGRLQGSAPHCVAGGALTHMFCWQIRQSNYQNKLSSAVAQLG